MGFFSGLFGANDVEKGVDKARKELRTAQNDSLGYYEPYDGLTKNALLGLTDATGLGDSDAAIAAFKDSPLYRLNYEAMLRAGADGVNARAQAGGMNNSGRTLLQLQEDAGNTTNQLYTQWMNPLADLTQAGIGIAGQKAGIRTGAGEQIAQNRVAKGQAKASKWGALDGVVDMGMNALGMMAGGGTGFAGLAGNKTMSGTRGMYF